MKYHWESRLIRPLVPIMQPLIWQMHCFWYDLRGGSDRLLFTFDIWQYLFIVFLRAMLIFLLPYLKKKTLFKYSLKWSEIWANRHPREYYTTSLYQIHHTAQSEQRSVARMLEALGEHICSWGLEINPIKIHGLTILMMFTWVQWWKVCQN